MLLGDNGADLLCIPNSTNSKAIEDKSERCSSKMSSTLKVIWTSLRKIQFAERLSQLITDLRIRSDCQSKEYLVFKNMVLDSGRSAINVDCKILMDYSPDLFITKIDYCKKHYVDQIELMVRLVALGNRGFWNSLKDCVYHKFGMDFSDAYIIGKSII
jgi:hypothetical protein